MLLIDIQRIHRNRRWPRKPFDHRGFPKKEACQIKPNREALARNNRVQAAQQWHQAQAVHHLERRWFL